MVKWEIGYPTSSVKGNGLAGQSKIKARGKNQHDEICTSCDSSRCFSKHLSSSHFP